MKRIPINSLAKVWTLSLTIASLLWSASARATLQDYQKAVTNEASLISYYTFDRTNANDSVGPNNGALAGTAKFGAGVLGAGLAVQLDGAGRVTLGLVPAFDFAPGTGSVEAWVRADWPGVLGAYNPCIFADRDGGPVTWSVHMNGDKSGVGVWNGNTYAPLAIPPPGTNWHHLAVVFDNSSGLGLVTIYWDGAAVGTRNQDLGPSPETTQLGSSSAGATDEGWVGMLDEVAFYAEALSEASVQTHYQALFIGTPPVIVTQPRSGIYLPGVPLQLKVVATGPNLSYQWFKNGNPISGAKASALAFPSLAAADAATYHVVVSNPASNLVSSDAIVALAPSLAPALVAYEHAVTNEPSLISYYTFDRLTAADTKGAHDGMLQGTADFGQGLAGGPDQALLLDGAGFVGFGSVPDFDFLSGAGSVEAWVRADWTSIGYNPAIFADREGGTVDWSIHMTSDKRAVGMWNGMTYQPFPMPDAGANWHALAVVWDSGNFSLYWDGVLLGTIAQPLGSSPATVQLGSSSGLSTTEGWIGMLDEVAFYGEALPAASVQAHYAAFLGNAPPLITVQPVGGTSYPGRPLQLTVWAAGAQLSYQWYKNGSPISGATNWTLAFTSLAASDAGAYYAKVSNPGGTTSSMSATLQVGSNLAQYPGRRARRGQPDLVLHIRQRRCQRLQGQPPRLDRRQRDLHRGSWPGNRPGAVARRHRQH